MLVEKSTLFLLLSGYLPHYLRRMNLVFLFLTRSDLDAIPRIGSWLNTLPPHPTVVAFVNPHLAIDPSAEQVSLESRILDAMRSTLVASSDRLSLEMSLQQRWMQIPRDVLVGQLEVIFRPFGVTTKTGLVVLSESFQADRLTELLTKIRPAWPPQIPLGEFLLVFPNQIPEPRSAGRPPGKVMDPEKKRRLQESMAKAREAKKAKLAAQTASDPVV